jgi:LIVCS family branched-chain amino acid:cation transporter
MVLALFDNFFKGNSYVYLFTMICTSFISILESLGQFGLKVDMLNSLPFYSRCLGWIISAAVGTIAGFIYGNLRNKELEKKYMLKCD